MKKMLTIIVDTDQPEPSTETQNKQILRDLARGRKITALSALTEYGCMRLAARINELRETWNIQTTIIELSNGKKIAQYTLVKP